MRIQDTVPMILGAANEIGRALAIELARNEVQGLALVDSSDSVLDIAREANEVRGDLVAFGFIGNLDDPVFKEMVFERVFCDAGWVNVCIPIWMPDSTVEQELSTPSELFRTLAADRFVSPVSWSIDMMTRISALELRRPGAGVGDADATIVFVEGVPDIGVESWMSVAASAALNGAVTVLNSRSQTPRTRCAVVRPRCSVLPRPDLYSDCTQPSLFTPDDSAEERIPVDDMVERICSIILSAHPPGESSAHRGWHWPI